MEGFNEFVLWDFIFIFNDKELEFFISGFLEIDCECLFVFV